MTAAHRLAPDFDAIPQPRSFDEWHEHFGHLLYEVDELGQVRPSSYFIEYCRAEELSARNGLPLADEVLRFREQVWKFVLDEILDESAPPQRKRGKLTRNAIFVDEHIEEGNGGRCTDSECWHRRSLGLKSKCTHQVTGRTRVLVSARDQHAVLRALVALADYDTWVTGRHLVLHRKSKKHKKCTVERLAIKADMPERQVARVLKVFRGESLPRETGEIGPDGVRRREFALERQQRRIVQVVGQRNPRFGKAASVYIILLSGLLESALVALAKRAAAKSTQHRQPEAKPIARPRVEPPAPASAPPREAPTQKAPPVERAPEVVDQRQWLLVVDVIKERRGVPVASTMDVEGRTAILGVIRNIWDRAQELELDNAYPEAVRTFDTAFCDLDRPYLKQHRYPLRCLWSKRDGEIRRDDLDDAHVAALQLLERKAKAKARNPTAAHRDTDADRGSLHHADVDVRSVLAQYVKGGALPPPPPRAT